MNKIQGDFWAFSHAPLEGTIAMDFHSLVEAQEFVKKAKSPIHHWSLMGMVDGEPTTVYEEKDGIVLKNLWSL